MTYMRCKGRTRDSLIVVKDPSDGEGLMVRWEIGLIELEMEYVCIPNNVLEQLWKFIVGWVLITLSLKLLEIRFSKYQFTNMQK